VTIVLFVIALVVAALGIPGVLPWLRCRSVLANEAAALTREVRAARRDLSAAVNARTLVPPSSPSGVVYPRPPGPSPIPRLSAEDAAINLSRALSNQSSSALWANVNAARAAKLTVPTVTQLREHALDDIEAAVTGGREDPPAPCSRERWS
jgi:hypothetical protein